MTFVDGSTTLGPGTLDNTGHASYTTTAFQLTVGSHSITANYATDGNYASSSSSTLSQTTTADPTTTTVTSSANPAVPGQPVTFTAIVSPVAPGGGTPTGTVTFTSGSTTSGPVPVVGGQASWTTSFPAAGSPTITASFANTDGNYKGSSASLTQTVLAPGVFVSGTTLYIVGGSTSSDTASVKPAGTKNDGSTGLAVSATLNKVSSSKSFTQPFTAIVFAGYAGNETFTLASTLTLPATITAGNGNDVVQLGAGDSTVTLGNGNDSVSAGGGNNTVTVGNGNDSVSAGGGNNTVTVGNGNDSVSAGGGNNTVTAGNGNDSIHLGNGSNVVVEGTGNDSVTAGTGDNFIVGGLGKHTIQVGNGNNILIDGSATVSHPDTRSATS